MYYSWLQVPFQNPASLSFGGATQMGPVAGTLHYQQFPQQLLQPPYLTQMQQALPSPTCLQASLVDFLAFAF